MLKGEPALVDSTSPRWGEKACYYSGVCLEAGEVEAMEIAGNSNAETSTAFLRQLREKHLGTSGSDLGQWASPPRRSDSQLFDHRAFSFSCLVGKAHHVESFAEMDIVAA